MQISIILPTFNESGHIAALLESIEKELGKSSAIKAYEILIVDDSPNQETVTAVENYQNASSENNLSLHHRTNSKGLADAVRFGFEKARYDNLMVMDSDFNHHPRYLPIIADLLQHYDLVVGSRYIIGGGMRTSLFRYAGSFFFNSMVRFFLRTRVHDNLSGFIGIRRKLYDQLFHDEIFYGYGDYAIRLIYNARMFKPAIIEIPVIYEFRASGTSKTNLFKCLFSYTGCVLSTLMHFKRRN